MIQGQFKISDKQDVVLSTVLGSCVSVCLYDEVRQVGGMNHYLLAQSRDPGSREIKYGAMAMELLINALLRAGADRKRLKAKLFGGSRISGSFEHIGSHNADFAEQFMAREEISVVSRSLRGNQPRRVHFCPTDGRARVLMIPNASDPTRLVPMPAPSRPEPDITLF